MATNKKDEIQIVKIAHNGQEYTARWNTRAFRQFLNKFKEAQKDEAANSSNAIAIGVDYIEISYDVLDGMMIRAGMSQDAIEDIDAVKYTKEAAKLFSWFQTTMGLMNEIQAPKNEEAVTEVN